MVARPLSEREILPYLLGYLTLTIATVFIPGYCANVWDALSALSFTVLVLGEISIYRQNSGANGHDFLQRYLAIGWVVIFRWLLIFMVTTVIGLILLELANISTLLL